MSKVRIIQEDGEAVIPDPEFIDVLLNVNEIAVDGEIYKDVVQVTFDE